MSRVIFYSNFKMNGHNLACFQKNTRWLIVIKHKQSARIKRKNNKLVLCFTTVMFWLLRRVCIYYPRPWNLSQFNVKNVFRQWEIFPEVAVYADACAYIDGKLLIYLCLTSKVNIYAEAYGYYAPLDKTS